MERPANAYGDSLARESPVRLAGGRRSGPCQSGHWLLLVEQARSAVSSGGGAFGASAGRGNGGSSGGRGSRYAPSGLLDRQGDWEFLSREAHPHRSCGSRRRVRPSGIPPPLLQGRTPHCWSSRRAAPYRDPPSRSCGSVLAPTPASDPVLRAAARSPREANRRSACERIGVAGRRTLHLRDRLGKPTAWSRAGTGSEKRCGPPGAGRGPAPEKRCRLRGAGRGPAPSGRRNWRGPALSRSRRTGDPRASGSA